jgi:hypothetical protein
MQDLERKEQSEKASALMGEIFGAFRQARSQADGGAQKAFEALQDKIAEHAGELIRLGFSGMKEIVDMLMKLDGVLKDEADDSIGNEATLQKFLRKADDSAEVMTQ